MTTTSQDREHGRGHDKEHDGEHDGEMAALVAEHSERLFADLATPDMLARADAGHWNEREWASVVASGFLDALVPVELGGAGLAPADAFALARRAAYHALPLPLGETLVARGLWSAAGGKVDAIDGPWTLASNDAMDLPRLQTRAGGFRLRGTLRRLAWAHRATTAVVQARDDSDRPCLVRVGLASSPFEPSTSLANEARDTVTLDATVSSGDVLMIGHAGIAALTATASTNASGANAATATAAKATPLPRVAGALLRAQQMAGAMQRCLQLSIQYAGERVQFGQPIGKFPAVQAMLVEAAGETAAAGAAVEFACSRWDGDAGQLELVAAVAKSRAGEAAGKVATACHQVHGAIGFTQEHVLHHFTRRLWSWRDEFGSEAWWNRRLGEIVCKQGADALWPVVTRL